MYAPTNRAIPRVLCVCEAGALRDELARELGDGFDLEFADGAADASDALRGEAPDAVVIASRSEAAEVFELLELIATRTPTPACVVVDPSGARSRVEAVLDAGADLYLISPGSPRQLFDPVTG